MRMPLPEPCSGVEKSRRTTRAITPRRTFAPQRHEEALGTLEWFDYDGPGGVGRRVNGGTVSNGRSKLRNPTDSRWVWVEHVLAECQPLMPRDDDGGAWSWQSVKRLVTGRHARAGHHGVGSP